MLLEKTWKRKKLKVFARSVKWGGLVMKTLTKVWDFIRDMLGFRRNSKYVKNYLNDANIKSSIYMAFIVIVLELWMIFRNVHEYVIPKWDNHPGFTSHFDLIYAHIGLYVLFIFPYTTLFRSRSFHLMFFSNISIFDYI